MRLWVSIPHHRAVHRHDSIHASSGIHSSYKSDMDKFLRVLPLLLLVTLVYLTYWKSWATKPERSIAIIEGTCMLIRDELSRSDIMHRSQHIHEDEETIKEWIGNKVSKIEWSKLQFSYGEAVESLKKRKAAGESISDPIRCLLQECLRYLYMKVTKKDR